MALPSGRVGVNRNQVDCKGNIIGSGSSAQTQIDEIKSQIGTFEFSVVDGVAGYKKTGADTFTPFSTGGVGWICCKIRKACHSNRRWSKRFYRSP